MFQKALNDRLNKTDGLIKNVGDQVTNVGDQVVAELKSFLTKIVVGGLALGSLFAIPWFLKSKEDNSYMGKAKDVLKRHWKPSAGLAILAAATGAYAVTRPKKDASSSAEEESPEPTWFASPKAKASPNKIAKRSAPPASKSFLTSTPGMLTICAVVVCSIVLILYLYKRSRSAASEPYDDEYYSPV